MFLIVLKNFSSVVEGFASFLLISVSRATCWSLVALVKAAPLFDWLILSTAARPSVHCFLASAGDSLIIRSMKAGTSAASAPGELSSVGIISSEIVPIKAIWSALKNFGAVALAGAWAAADGPWLC